MKNGLKPKTEPFPATAFSNAGKEIDSLVLTFRLQVCRRCSFRWFLHLCRSVQNLAGLTASIIANEFYLKNRQNVRSQIFGSVDALLISNRFSNLFERAIYFRLATARKHSANS